MQEAFKLLYIEWTFPHHNISHPQFKFLNLQINYKSNHNIIFLIFSFQNGFIETKLCIPASIPRVT